MAERNTYVSSYEEEEGIWNGLVRNFKTRPAPMLSLVGIIGVVGYGVYRYKTKGMTFTPSLFLIQLRVGAQATAVGCLTIAMVYNMVNKQLSKKKE